MKSAIHAQSMARSMGRVRCCPLAELLSSAVQLRCVHDLFCTHARSCSAWRRVPRRDACEPRRSGDALCDVRESRPCSFTLDDPRSIEILSATIFLTEFLARLICGTSWLLLCCAHRTAQRGTRRAGFCYGYRFGCVRRPFGSKLRYRASTAALSAPCGSDGTSLKPRWELSPRLSGASLNINNITQRLAGSYLLVT